MSKAGDSEGVTQRTAELLGLLSRRKLLCRAASAGVISRLWGQASRSPYAAVLMRGVDYEHHCCNSGEIILSPAGVTKGIRKIYSLGISELSHAAVAQPLIIPGLLMGNGARRDAVVIYADNVIRCFDPENGKQMWSRKLGEPVRLATNIDGAANLTSRGTDTPVVDLATGSLYCGAWWSPDGSERLASYSIFTVSLRDGVLSREPCSLSGVNYKPGGGMRSQVFSNRAPWQSTSLLLMNIGGRKNIFFCASGVTEGGEHESGWIVSYDVEKNLVSAVLSLAPRFYGALVTMSGQGLSADSAGYLYCMTGSGGFDGITDFGDSFIKIRFTPSVGTTPSSLKVVDWWTPFSDSGRVGAASTAPAASQARAGQRVATSQFAPPPAGMRDERDVEGSNVSIISELGIAFGSGRDGILYVMDARNMGRTMPKDLSRPAGNFSKLKQPPLWFTYNPGSVSPHPSHAADLNFLSGLRTHHMHSASAVLKTGPGMYRVFCWGENSVLRAWSVTSRGFSYLGSGEELASPSAPAPPGGGPGGLLCVSSHGVSDAILWATVPVGDAMRAKTQGNLYAYDALNSGKRPDGSGALKLLYKSPPFDFNAGSPPIVSGGRVFVPTSSGSVEVYGL